MVTAGVEEDADGGDRGRGRRGGPPVRPRGPGTTLDVAPMCAVSEASLTPFNIIKAKRGRLLKWRFRVGLPPQNVSEGLPGPSDIFACLLKIAISRGASSGKYFRRMFMPLEDVDLLLGFLQRHLLGPGRDPPRIVPITTF